MKPFRALAFVLMLSTPGCHAQTKAPSIAPELARRVEVLIRSKSNIPPDYVITVADRRKSDLPGYDEITVNFLADGHPGKPVTFLISDDNKTLAQFSKYDISQDPKTLVSGTGRPARGGPETAPVTIVGFDDLECPYCARMHAQLFPAIMDRYKDQVRVVYLDFPLTEIHPWAKRAAIDSNCLGAQSTTGYWNLIDYIHAHASEFGGTEHAVAKANDMLDTITKEEGERQKVKSDLLAACIVKQDDSAITISRREGERLGVGATPALFINGERLEGALPIEYVYRMIDHALTAEGKTPPPPVPVPSLTGAQKPGN